MYGLPLDKQTANDVYDILVQICDAPEGMRDVFVHSQTRDFITEYRFIGSLGFGGKFWRAYGYRGDGSYGERWYVNQYQEHGSDKDRATIEAANKALWTLQNN